METSIRVNESLSEAQPVSIDSSTSRFTHKTARRQQVLIVLGAALGLGGGFAPIYFGTLSVFLKPVATEFGWGRAETSAAGVLSMLGLAFGAVLMGRLIDRYGPARVISSSVLAMAGLIVSLSLVANSAWLFGGLSFAVGVAGAATTPPGYLSVLAQRFDRRLGLALGLAGMGMGMGTVLMPMIAQWLINSYGWRAAYTNLAMGAAVLGGLACALLFLRNGKSTGGVRLRGVDSTPVTGDSVKEALRSPRFWLLISVVFVVSAASLGVAIHLVAMITDRGITATVAASAAAISGVGVVLGRLISGVLLDMYSARRIASLAFAFALAGLGVLALVTGVAAGFGLLATSALLIGFAIGAEGDFLPFFVRRYFGLKAFSSIYGLLFFAFGVGGVVGPTVFGVCFDRLGGYSVAMWGATVALLFAAAAILRLGPYRYGPDAV
ncbi:MAG: MFS transporter [Burkholderiaceae bacterium]|nr:MFS transporter [Burkholderiaceae bacterium]